ncbi:MAG: hypothetical protein ACRDQ7_13410 [Haloechinothrix sp.]
MSAEEIRTAAGDVPPLTAADVREGIEKATAIVELATEAVDNMSPF